MNITTVQDTGTLHEQDVISVIFVQETQAFCLKKSAT